jgi:hypothetical protein
MTRDEINARLWKRLYGGKVIENQLRGALVEELCAVALGDDWNITSEDWAAYDLEGPDGTRIQVKQSAALQTWGVAKTAQFSIARKTGRWEGADWINQPGHQADLYMLFWHPIKDETADHWDPDQWCVYVIPTDELPNQKSISLSQVERRWNSVRLEDLQGVVARILTN